MGKIKVPGDEAMVPTCNCQAGYNFASEAPTPEIRQNFCSGNAGFTTSGKEQNIHVSKKNCAPADSILVRLLGCLIGIVGLTSYNDSFENAL